MIFKILFFTALTAISILAVLPSYSSLPDLVSYSDVINHIVAFSVLMSLFQLAYPKIKNYLHVVLLFSYGIIIELIQHGLPTRHGDLYDVVSDLLGILIALIFMRSYAIISKKV